MIEPINILVVDDEKLVLTAFRIELQDAGFQVKTAISGADALELVQQEFFDIVYTDLIMPEMNGTELCRKIKEVSAQTEVVLFSGSPFEVDEQQLSFIEAGGRDEMLRKPLEDGVLISITNNIVKELSYKRNYQLEGGSNG